VSKEEEMSGLDMGEHGYSAYPEFITQESVGGMITEQTTHAPASSPDGVRT